MPWNGHPGRDLKMRVNINYYYKMDDLTIRPLPQLERVFECLIHPLLPQGSALIVAPSFSGKSTLLVNMILRARFGLCVHYQKIIIFSPTVHQDSSWDLLQPSNYFPSPVRCRDGKRRMSAEILLDSDFNTDKVQAVLDSQEALETRVRPRVLLILDDLASELQQGNITMNRLLFRGRHSKVWCYITSQLYRRVPRAIRVNMGYLIFFQVNQNELKTISEELSTGSVREFEDLFKKCTSKQFSFLCVDMKKPVDKRYLCNFKPI